jgi:hypothetical protein
MITAFIEDVADIAAIGSFVAMVCTFAAAV